MLVHSLVPSANELFEPFPFLAGIPAVFQLGRWFTWPASLFPFQKTLSFGLQFHLEVNRAVHFTPCSAGLLGISP